MPSNIGDTLAERGSRYGDYESQCGLSDSLVRILEQSPNWAACSPPIREAARQICCKLGRCFNGDWTYDDNWRDIVGYAQLVLDGMVPSQPSITLGKLYDIEETDFGPPGKYRVVALCDDGQYLIDVGPGNGHDGMDEKYLEDWTSDLGSLAAVEALWFVKREHIHA